MAITFVEAVVGNLNGNSIQIDAPTSMKKDDFVLIHAYHDGNPIQSLSFAIQDLPGFPANSTNPASPYNHWASTTGQWRDTALMSQIIGPAPAPTGWLLEFGNSFGPFNTSAILTVWRGVDLDQPYDKFPTAFTLAIGQNNNNPAPPAFTPVTDGAMIVVAGNISADDITAPGAPTGYTLAGSAIYAASPGGSQPHIEEPTAANANLIVAYRELETAATETPGVFTNSETMDTVVADYTAWTTALRPAPVPPPSSFSAFIKQQEGYFGSIADRAMQYLTDLGYTTGSLTDRKMAWLGDLGYTGSLNDRLAQWKNS